MLATPPPAPRCCSRRAAKSLALTVAVLPEAQEVDRAQRQDLQHPLAENTGEEGGEWASRKWGVDTLTTL
ncbi:MAG: hypothetical protein HC938_17715 [Nitrospira sp.]|nr:hypothetical protein [Nitrospira sp.]